MAPLDLPGLDELASRYAEAGEREFALYLGAGVNCGGELSPRCSWPKLIEALYEGDKPFDELRAAHGNNWPRLAAAVTRGHGLQETVERIDDLIHEGLKRSRSIVPRKQELPYGTLEKMPNLEAAICFASAIHDPRPKRSFRANPRIGAVLTSNYDYFFASGLTRYRSFPAHWKVVTFKSSRPKEHQRPICYLHGYIPLKKVEGEIRAERLVLEEQRYKEFHAEGGFARTELHGALARHDVLFLGTSFADDPLQEAARRYGEERRYFVLVAAGDEQTLGRLGRLPVTPVIVERYGQIPDLLEQVYAAGLTSGDRAAYWAKLKWGLEPPSRDRGRSR